MTGQSTARGGGVVLTATRDALMRRVIVPALLRADPTVAYRVAAGLGTLRWRTARRQRRRAERRIREILAPASPAAVDAIARGLFVTRMKSRLREMPLAGMSDAAFSSRVMLEGRDILERALARGNGVILLGAHFGPGRLLAYVLRRYGYPIVRVGNPPRDPLVRAIDQTAYASLERRTGRRFEDIFLPVQGASVSHAVMGRHMLRVLQERRILFIAPDGRSIANTVLVPLFGRPVGLSPGWHALARMSGAAVIPSFAATRCRAPSLVIRLEPEIPRALIESADPVPAATAFVGRLEAHIRRFPCNAVFLFLGPDGRRALHGSWGRSFWPSVLGAGRGHAAGPPGDLADDL